jgi:hypothetical protein
MLVLLIEGIYEVRRWDGFMWHYIRTKFHEDWGRRSSNINSIIFWDMTPCSLLQLANCLLAKIISSTLKMEAICSSEASVGAQQTTRRHIPEDNTLHNHRCENLKCYKGFDSEI